MEHQGAQITNRNHHHHHPYNGGGGGREDCWTEGATAILIEAWGDRYLQLSRGNLRQKDWKDVADAVNGRSDGVRPRRTDIQCKNRIDTIKKKYKLEKSKPAPSQWPFYSRLDHLIGTTTPPANRKTTNPHPSPPLPLSLSLPSYLHKSPAVTFTVKHGKGKMYNHNPNPNPNAAVYSGGSSSKSRLNSHDSTESSGGGGGGGGGGEDDDDDDVDDDDDTVFNNGSARKQHQMGRDSSDGTAFKELAKAVLKFGEIYERIENSKQQQMMELERQRMEFTKDLEFQRMQMFMEAQLELEKMKRPNHASTTGDPSNFGKKL